MFSPKWNICGKENEWTTGNVLCIGNYLEMTGNYIKIGKKSVLKI